MLANGSYRRIYVVTDTGSGFTASYYYISNYYSRPFYGSPAIYDNMDGSFEIYWGGYYYFNHVSWTGSGFSNYWSYYTGYSSYYDTPCVDANGYVFFGSDADEVRCFSPSGSLVWTSPYWYDVKNVSLADDGYLYCVDQYRRLHKVGPNP